MTIPTSQDFIDKTQEYETEGFDGVNTFADHGIDKYNTKKGFDELILKISKEARREALKEMDEAVEAYQQAKAYGIGDTQSYLKLRQEYSGK